jgi:hypothetical protein
MKEQKKKKIVSIGYYKKKFLNLATTLFFLFSISPFIC